MTSFDTALTSVSRLGIDTAPIVYLVERHLRYLDTVRQALRHVADGRTEGITSVVTLGGDLAQPYGRGDARLAQEYRDFLLASANLQTLPIDAAAADRAAELRARYRLRLPDALQIAVALIAGCQAFLTNDRALQRVTDLKNLILDDLES